MKTSGASVVELGGGAAVQLDEALDPFARLGRHLRGLGGGGEAEHEVELAPARDLDHARELDLAQLDRGPGERAHDGGGVLRIDQQPQPGEHVAHLGALEKRPRLLATRRAAARRTLCRGATRWAGRRRRGDSGAGHQRKDTRGGLCGELRDRTAATLCGVDVIDWSAAQRIGELIAGSPPFGGVRAASVEPLAREFAGRVSAYSGLRALRRAAGARAGRPPGLDRGEPEAACSRCWRR